MKLNLEFSEEYSQDFKLEITTRKGAYKDYANMLFVDETEGTKIKVTLNQQELNTLIEILLLVYRET